MVINYSLFIAVRLLLIIMSSQSPLARLAGNILLVASGRDQGGSIIIRGQQPGPGPEAASGAGRPAQLHLTLVMTRDAELSSSLRDGEGDNHPSVSVKWSGDRENLMCCAVD